MVDLDALAATLKPLLRGWLHAAMFPLVLAAGVVLVVLAPSGAPRLAAAIYALTSALLFGVSALYHRVRWTPRVERWLKRFDHANIFLVIAGTYTPFAALALHGTTRRALLITVWSVALAGTVFRVAWPDAPRWLYTPLYVVLPWSALFVLPQFADGAGVAALVLVGVGGVLYTLGGVVYGVRWPNSWPRVWGFHEWFHLATVAAWVTHYVAVSLVTYRGI